jgi:predicted N-acetyltransferase YhbS
MKITLSDELPEDAAAIELLLQQAFQEAPHSNQSEHLIVRQLRASGDLSFALVARLADAVVGYAAVSPVTVADAAGWYGVGPVAVSPAHQNRGIGSRLMHNTLMRLRDMGAGGCVVVGEPEFYRRFGFRELPGLHFPGVAPEYFLAVSFAGATPRGEVSYSEAFSQLEV